MKHNTGKKIKISALWRRLMLIVLGVILGINVYLANAKGLTGNQLPMPFGTGMAVVLSGSMEPKLRKNDLLIIREAADYYVKDIVVYQSGHDLIVHRIIAKNGSTFITQGDANNTADSPIEKSAIKGKVVFRIPVAGLLVNAIRTPIGILAVLICAFLLIELSFHKEKETDTEKLEAIKEEIRRLKAEQENEPDEKEKE